MNLLFILLFEPVLCINPKRGGCNFDLNKQGVWPCDNDDIVQ